MLHCEPREPRGGSATWYDMWIVTHSVSGEWLPSRLVQFNYKMFARHKAIVFTHDENHLLQEVQFYHIHWNASTSMHLNHVVIVTFLFYTRIVQAWMHMRHPMFRAFKLCTSQKDLQLYHTIVVAMSSNHTRDKQDLLSSPELPFMPILYFYFVFLVK